MLMYVICATSRKRTVVDSLVAFLSADAGVSETYPGGVHAYQGSTVQGGGKCICIMDTDASRGYEVGVAVVVDCLDMRMRLACSRATTALYFVTPVVRADGKPRELNSGIQEAYWMHSPGRDLVQLGKDDCLELANAPYTKGVKQDEPLGEGRPDNWEYRKYRTVKKKLLRKLGIEK